MCGIVGIYTPNHSVDSTRVAQMLTRLQHRGPDGQGIFDDRDVCLGHARLSIIDLEQGQQPLKSPDQRYVLVANGEIYNHVELRAVLKQQGAEFLTGSDCEVILPLAARAPEAFIDQLNGMFAFALFDRVERSLLLVRDRFGIKPLYYLQLKDGIAFASEIKALLPLLDTVKMQAAGVERFLQINFNAGVDTAFASIKRLLPGQALHVDAEGRQTLRNWWSLSEALATQVAFQGSMGEAVEQFDQCLQQSLTEHLRSDVPVGLFLSGGVDSGILATQLGRTSLSSGRPKAWSLGFPSTSVHDEVHAAQATADASGIELALIRMDPSDLFKHWVYSIWAMDELMGDFASLPTLMLADAAAHSHKVVLMGEGGDEVFAGYGRYRMPWLQSAWHALKTPGTGGFRTRGRFDKASLSALLSPSVRAGMKQNWREPFIDAWQAGKGLDPLTRRQYVDMQTWLADDLLLKADRMLMVKGVEGRVPFLDHRLVLMGLSLPAHLKIQQRLGKQVPRAWLQKHQKAFNASGKKKGFSVPVTDWIQGLSRQKLASALLSSAIIQDVCQVQELALRLQSSAPIDKSLAEALAVLLQLAVWSKLFLEGDGLAPPYSIDPLDWLLAT